MRIHLIAILFALTTIVPAHAADIQKTLAVIYELAGSPPFTVVATLVALPFTTI